MQLYVGGHAPLGFRETFDLTAALQPKIEFSIWVHEQCQFNIPRQWPVAVTVQFLERTLCTDNLERGFKTIAYPDCKGAQPRYFSNKSVIHVFENPAPGVAQVRQVADAYPEPLVQCALEIGQITIDTARRQVSRNGEEIRLTPAEYNLLEYLVLRRGRVVPKSQLRDCLSNSYSEAVSNVVEVLVSNVCRKIDPEGVNNILRTKRGFGYFVE